jgi:hypothetical protein
MQDIFAQSAQALARAMTAAGGLTGARAPQVTAAGYNPAMMQVPGQVAASMVQPGQIAATNLQPYMNPFQQNVTDTTMQELNRQRLLALQGTGAQATAARAFGGSRHGIAEAETNRGFADQAARTLAQLNANNFTNAQAMAGQDIATGMQGQLANQAAGLQAQTTNLNAGMQAAGVNQQAANTAGQFNASAQNAASMANAQNTLAALAQRLGAANSLAGMGQQAFGIGQQVNNDLARQGAMQQGVVQAVLDAARRNYEGFTNSPQQSLNLPLAALGAIPQGGGGTQTTTKQPGLFDLFGLLLAL